MPVPSCLTDEDLKATLCKHGVKPGPITGEGYEKIFFFKPLLIFFPIEEKKKKKKSLYITFRWFLDLYRPRP